MDWTAVIIGLVSVVSAIFAGRASQRVAKINVESEKVKAETEAYNRARKMDIDTIEFQGKKIERLEKENDRINQALISLRQENQILHEDNDRLRRRILGIEHQQEGEHSG